MAQFTCHQQLTPPSCISLSVKCHFSHASKLDLVVIKSNILCVYRIYTTTQNHDHDHQDAPVKLEDGSQMEVEEEEKDQNVEFDAIPTARLELLHEFVLQGIVTSIGACKLLNSSLDALLLSFNDAKMSLIEYSSYKQDLVTVSMHNYEREELLKDISVRGSPTVKVDHQSRCAIFYFYNTYFAILPFKYDSGVMMDEVDEEKRKYPFHPSFVISESDIDPQVRNIIDFTFLYGYQEPTLAILYEHDQSFVGRLAQRKDTVSLIVVSLDIFTRTYPVLYRVDGLPYNSTHIEAVPAPVGGVLIFSHNALIHLDQTHTPGFACLVNPYFDLESHFKSQPNFDGTPNIPVKNKPQSIYIRTGKVRREGTAELGVALDGCRCTFLAPDVVLVILRNGEMLQVDLIGEDTSGQAWNRKRGGVKDIQIKRLGLTTCSPSCIIPLADLSNFMKPQILSRIVSLGGVRNYSNYFFVGSIISDAVLVQYFQPIDHGSATTATGSADDMAMEEDELDAELYGDSTAQPNQIKSDINKSPEELAALQTFKFRICDTILVMGPLKNIALGQPAASTYPYVGEPIGQHLEIVACGGNDLHGSLLVMHETVRPVILSSFPLGDTDDMWSVRVTETREVNEHDFHKYLVISKGSGTSILKTGEELEELEKSGFYVEGPTVCVGTALNESIVVQIYPNGIVLLSPDAVRLVESAVGDDDIWIVSCFINDPYIVLLLNTGQLRLFSITCSSPENEVGIKDERELELELPIACIALYTDDSTIQQLPLVGEVTLEALNDEQAFKGTSSTEQGGTTTIKKRTKDEMDDMDLYGEVIGDDDDVIMDGVQQPPVLAGAADEENLFEQEDQTIKVTDIDGKQVRTAPVRHWCFTVDDSGTLRIYSLPDLVQRFIFYDFRLASRFVYDHVNMPDNLEKSTNFPLLIDELAVLNLGSDDYRSHPYVVARTNKCDLFIYKIIPSIEHTPGTTDDRLSLRMVRIDHSYITREPQVYSDKDGDKFTPVEPDAVAPNFIKKVHIIPFDKIGHKSKQLYAGICVTGERPVWIMMAHSGVREGLGFTVKEGFEDANLPSASMNSSNAIRIHPMLVDGPLSAFAPIHNVNIPYGFAYINKQGLFRLCQLPPHFSYDRDWPVCNVPLGRSAAKIAYHSLTSTYILASSSPSDFAIDTARYMAAVAAGVIKTGEELPEAEKKVSGIMDVIENRDPGMYHPQISEFQLELISPVTWETIDIIKMGQFEQILAVEVVELFSKENTSGKKLYIAVGTGFLRSEDLASRGRLIVYDVIDVVPEPGRPQTCHKMKPAFKNDEKQPVTAICACNGYLLAAVGPKILMYSLKDGALDGIAFLDVSFFVVSLSSVKSFILISDAFKSVWFAVFQQEPPKIALLGKDLYPTHVFGGEFIIADKSLSILISDDQSNIQMMVYEPQTLQSLGGQRLLRRGEMNIGTEIQAFAKIRVKTRNKDSKWYGVIAGTKEGGLSKIMPINEKLYRRLYGLYSRMVSHIEHHAGLNPRGFRQIKMPVKSIHASSITTGPPGPRGILDGDLVLKYLCLPLTYQRELAKAIGTRDERIIDDFLDLADALEYF